MVERIKRIKNLCVKNEDDWFFLLFHKNKAKK